MFKKRRTLMPIQYVIGEWEFRDLLLKMRKPVLIPRQETSGLVEIVQNKLKLQQFQGKSNINFLEIGCGSGAISLSLLKENINLSGVAIDLQKHCVQLTNENANLNKIDKRKLVVLHQSWKEFMSQQESLHKQQQLDYPQFDFIVSNPPYIPTNQIKSLDKSVRNFEDVCALDGGVEGLDLILSILEKGHSILKPGGFIAMEVDRTHNKQLLKLYDEQKEFFHFYSSREFFKDIYSQDRFCLFFKKN